MEITEPVILEIPQGKRRVRVELTSRADGRDLIAAIATAMLRLPDDGEGHADSHGERAAMSGDELDTAIGYLGRDQLELVLHHAHGYCAVGVEQAVNYERRPMARYQVEPEPDPAAIPTADGEHVTCPSCGFRDGRHNPAGCRRQKQLADLAKQVARLSHPDASADREGYAPDDSIAAGPPVLVTDDEDGPCMMVGCGHDYDDHSLDLERGDRLYCQRCFCRRFLSATAMQSHRSVRLLRDGDALVVVESTPCPERHPAKQTACVAGEHHGPPCRDLDGDEWVPALTAVTGS